MKRIVVVGLGQIGGSLARSLSRAGHEVLGVDSPRAWAEARAAGAVVSPRAPLLTSVRSADFVFLAAPPRSNLELLRRVSRASPGVVTDVSSVKGPICRLAARLRLSRFVGGHPMAGGTGTGFQASVPDLFVGRPWILTPVGDDPHPERKVAALLRSLGARVFRLEAKEHDRVVAFLSHVPQLVAWALSRAAREDGAAGTRLELAGPAFREMTRLAASPRGLWREILELNRAEVGRALRSFSRALGRGI